MIIGIMLIASSIQISDATTERRILEWGDFQKTENTSEFDAFLSYGIKRVVDWQKIDSECSFQLVSLKSEIVIFSSRRPYLSIEVLSEKVPTRSNLFGFV